MNRTRSSYPQQPRRARVLATVSVAAVLALLFAGPTAGSTLARHGPGGASRASVSAHVHRHLLVDGLEGSLGSTVGPDGALYVVEGIACRVTRIDPRTGASSVFVTGLPKRVLDGLGGATDIAFLDGRAYVLVTLVSPDVGGTHADGIYRVDGKHQVSLVADIGAFALAHPPTTDFFVPTGLQFAIQTYRGKFLVTDGHHNRVYLVTSHGRIKEVETFGDIVPTGLEVREHRVFLAEAGPVPHLPATGTVVRLHLADHTAEPVASGAPLLVDVEARGERLFALSQGVFPAGGEPGSPANPDTGSLVRVRADGDLVPVARKLDRPTSLEFIDGDAYVVTLGGEVWRLTGLGEHS